MKYLVKTENNKKSGVYLIRNIKNGRFYIGSTSKIRNRFRGHRSALLNNNHDNQFLQNDWNKCGPESFVFEEYKITKDASLALEEEQELLDELFDDRKRCYNITSQTKKITGCYDKDLQRKRQSAAAKARWSRDRVKLMELRKSKDYRANLSESKSKEYIFINPDGMATTIVNLKKFCKENSLRTNDFYAILNGKRLFYKGWSLKILGRKKVFTNDQLQRKSIAASKKSKRYVFTNPNKKRTVIYNLKSYCRANQLIYRSMFRLLKGEIGSHKGWTRVGK